jgi:hypothetical protein
MVIRLEKGSFTSSYELLSVEVQNHRLSPAEAEVRVAVALRGVMHGAELRGRLVGPRCEYATTVEVAYPFRRVPLPDPNLVCVRAIIPEPSLWEPECPFLYQGPVELWGNGGPARMWQISHGFRAITPGPRAVRLNGQPLALRGVVRQQLPEADGRALRAAGYNALLVSLTGAAVEGREAEVLCDAADRLGFLVIARLGPDSLAGALELRDHASLLGWLLPQEMFEQEAARAAAVAALGNVVGHLLGVELTRPVPEEQLAGLGFVCCREELLPELAGLRRPKLVLTGEAPPGQAPQDGLEVLGWIRG